MYKFLYIILILSLTSCINKNEKENVLVKPELINKINVIVSEFESFIKSKDGSIYNPDIYEVRFIDYHDECMIYINSNIFYYSNLDGYLFLDENLIAFYNLNMNCNKFVEVESKIIENELLHFDDETENYDDYSPPFWVFKIMKDNTLEIYEQGWFKIDFNSENTLSKSD